MDEDDLHLDLEDPSGSTLGNQSSGNNGEESEHPTAVFFHFVFKIFALFLFEFQDFFSNTALLFVACILLLAFDFWTVKNVSGRLLVGLRWWNEVKEDGTNIWIYESTPEGRHINSKDSTLFWGSLYITPIVWAFLGMFNLLHVVSMIIVIVALLLSGANLVGYWNCQKDQKEKLQHGIASFITRRL